MPNLFNFIIGKVREKTNAKLKIRDLVEANVQSILEAYHRKLIPNNQHPASRHHKFSLVIVLKYTVVLKGDF